MLVSEISTIWDDLPVLPGTASSYGMASVPEVHVCSSERSEVISDDDLLGESV
jgi:hypothetical protein